MSSQNKKSILFLKIPIICAVALLTAFLVSSLLVSFAFIYGSSMEPTYTDGEVVILDKTRHTISNLKTGDVIIFKNKSISPYPIVKRIAAAEGQTVEITDGTLLVDGEAVELAGFPIPKNESMAKLTVPENSFFLIGDNPEESIDSRDPKFGTVTKKDIIGKVAFSLFGGK